MILPNAQLAYLFLVTLNDVDIATTLFENNQKVIKNMVNSFIDVLVIKGEVTILKKLLQHQDLTKLVVEL